MDGVEHTFGGYFSASYPPPGRSTPACKRAKPPPWTRGAWTAPLEQPGSRRLSQQEAATAPASIAGATLALAASDYQRILASRFAIRQPEATVNQPGFQQPANYARLVFGKRKIDVYFQDRVNQAILITTWSKAFRTTEGRAVLHLRTVEGRVRRQAEAQPRNTDPYKGTVYSYIVGGASSSS